MAKETMALLDYLRNVGVDGDFLREAVRVLSQVVMELEVEDQIGAGRYERTDSRKTYRNGYRERRWETQAGEVPLAIPKLRQVGTSRASWSRGGQQRRRC
jgi:transposase-like protein